MKTIIKSLAAFLMCAFAFTSCSSDDEPKVSSNEEIVTHIESVVNSHLGAWTTCGRPWTTMPKLRM